MEGQPVWLASYHRRDKTGRIIATGDYSESEMKFAERQLKKLLRRVGNPEKERCFRMNITVCLHRAATLEEVMGLPPSWHDDHSGIAGGPVEVLWSKGCKESSSAQPCKDPERHILDPSRPDLWIPMDCGECGPCMARAAI